MSLFPARGNRKLAVTFLALTLAFILALLSKLSPEFATIASICVGGFHFANATVSRATPPAE